MKERVKWIDVVRAFGIFMVYICHFGAAGRIYSFGHTHSVALFFFISGCTEALSTEENFLKYFIKKVKTVLIPAYFFALVSVAVYVIQTNSDWGLVKHTLILMAYGLIRNAFFAQTLWFLTCLFVMQIMFFFIKKLKNKLLIFGVSLGLYLVALRVFPLLNISIPSWSYNADSAVYYIIYYAIGYLAFPYIVQLFELDTLKKKIVFGVTGGGALYYVVRFFFGVDLLSYIKWPSFAYNFTPILVTCIIIWAYLVVSRVFQDMEGLRTIGKNSLYMCGNEYVIKEIVIGFLATYGIYVSYFNPLQIYIYIMILLVIINKFFVPVEKYILKKLVR